MWLNVEFVYLTWAPGVGVAKTDGASQFMHVTIDGAFVRVCMHLTILCQYLKNSE